MESDLAFLKIDFHGMPTEPSRGWKKLWKLLGNSEMSWDGLVWFLLGHMKREYITFSCRHIGGSVQRFPYLQAYSLDII